MAEYTTKYSPMHIDCTVGQPYGNPSSSYSCGFHTGVDFPQSGVAVQNPDLYSITDDGVVVYVYNQSQGTSPSLGNQVQIYDNRTGLYYRYWDKYNRKSVSRYFMYKRNRIFTRMRTS